MEDEECRCFATRKKGKKSDFYLAPDGQYYIDENTYLQRKHRVTYWNKIMDIIAEVTDYDVTKKFPTIVPKKLKELGAYDNEVIYETFVRNKDIIKYYMQTKEFKSEYQKFSYIMAIIFNNINDVEKEMKYRKKQNELMRKHEIKGEYSTQDINQEKQNMDKHKNVHDISGLLGENEWK